MTDKSSLSKPQRDDLTGGLIRPLDYHDSLALYKAKEDSQFTPKPQRFYASDIGRCLLQTFWKRTGEPKDAGATGFDDGIGERGDSTEAQITKVLRAVHGDDIVLQNVRFTKILDVPTPDGIDSKIALVFKSDPVLIGDNLAILQFWEIKSKGYNAWMKNRGLQRLLKEGLPKVPLLLAKVEAPEVDGAASFENLLQAAIGMHLARTEAGREPAQGFLHYVDPEKHTKCVTIVLSRSDIDVLAGIAERLLQEYYTYVVSGETPPPVFMMGWECGWCDWKNKCALRCKQTGVERSMHPLSGSVNEALERGRKLYAQHENDARVLEAQEMLKMAQSTIRELEAEYVQQAIDG